ncbi:MAG: polymerase, partial [Streptomyces sp.]|nr:polymerase [Streptomyces sp.]
SRLGRTSPPPSRDRQDMTDGDARAWGRFTRNFVIQASAAEWALAMMASLRRRLTALTALTALADGDNGGDGPRLVFFLHDEIIVHTPEAQAQAVESAVAGSAEEARRLVFGRTRVLFPLETHTVRCYADAK